MYPKYFKIGLILITIGLIILATSYVVYSPKITAFQNDTMSWLENRSTDPAPTLEDYGLNVTTLPIIGVLNTIAELLIFIGAAYLVILLVAKIVKRVRGYDVEA